MYDEKTTQRIPNCTIGLHMPSHIKLAELSSIAKKLTLRFPRHQLTARFITIAFQHWLV